VRGGFQSVEETAFGFSEVIHMKSKTRSVQLGRWILTKQEQAIERAIQNAKRTAFDKRFRHQWYRGVAISKWSPERRARYVEWRRSQKRHEKVNPGKTSERRQHVSVPRWISVIAYQGVAYGVDRDQQVFFDIGTPDQKIGFASRLGRQMIQSTGIGARKKTKGAAR
jgi:hypothetical protein